MKSELPRLSVGLDAFAGLSSQELKDALIALQHAGVHRVSVGAHLKAEQGSLRKAALSPFGLELNERGPDLAAVARLKPDWVVVKNSPVLSEVLSVCREKRVRVVLSVAPTEQAVDMALRLGVDEIQLNVGQLRKAPDRKRLLQLGLRARKRGAVIGVSGELTLDQLRILAPLDVFDTFHIEKTLAYKALLLGLESAARQYVSAVQAP